jgi:AhpD family alkylhydroperoxidase
VTRTQSPQVAAKRVEAIYTDIRRTRKSGYINNFWRTLARDPRQLEQVWHAVKDVTAPGALDELTKDLIYLAVSVTNGCHYCIASHATSARRKGMTTDQFTELLAVIGVANQTNRLATGYAVPTDAVFSEALKSLTSPLIKKRSRSRKR